MAIDSQIQAILDQFVKFGPQPLEQLSPDGARNNPSLKNAVEEMAAESLANRAIHLLKPMPEPVALINHIQIPTPEGGVLARVYTPKGEGPFPVLVYFHGGGWVIGSLDLYDSSCRGLCNAVKCIVVSVAYRLAPEAKFPAGVNDAYLATQWVMNNAASLNGDPKRVAVGGESAGGNLAAVVCLKIKAENGLMPVAQLLIYPVTDSRMNTESMNKFTETKPLNKAMMNWFYSHYLENESDKNNPFVSPMLAEDLKGLPPAIIVTAEYDPLRDEGEAYAKRLSDAKCLFDYTRYEGTVHEFFSLTGLTDKSKLALENVSTYLKNIFNDKKDT